MGRKLMVASSHDSNRGTPSLGSDARIGVVLFVILLACYVYVFPRWADWNQNSRLNLTMALVDRGVLYIDDYYQGHTQTGDYAEYGGHVYSDKAPGTALLGVPFYWLYRAAATGEAARWLAGRLQHIPAIAETLRQGGTGVLPDKVYAAAALSVVTMAVVSIPSALLGVLLYQFTRPIVPAPLPRAGAVLAYGLATSALPYSSALYGHQIVATLLFTAFFLAYQVGEGRGAAPSVAAIGLLLGWAVITEYPAALIALAIAAYLAYRLPRRIRLAWVPVGAILPGALWMAHNVAIFGRALALGYSYSTLYLDKHNVGFLSLTWPSIEALWGITFGSFRGLFRLSPILLLALPGLVLMARRRSIRPEALVCGWAFVAFLLFNGSSVMWEGGFAVGPRYLVPMLPFLVPPMAAAVERLGRRRTGRGALGILGTWSLLAVWAQTVGGQAFPDWTPNPLFHYSLARLLEGDVARNLGMLLGLSGLASLAPLGAFVAVLVGILVRLSVRGRAAEAKRRAEAEGGLGITGAFHAGD